MYEVLVGSLIVLAFSGASLWGLQHLYWWGRVQAKLGWGKGTVRAGDVKGLKAADRLLSSDAKGVNSKYSR